MAVWVKTTGSNIPEGAIRAGYEKDGKPLFIAQANMANRLLTPGKCGYHLPGAHISFGSKEQVVKQYEVLVHHNGTPGFYDWIHASNGEVPTHAYQTDRNMYVGRAVYSGSLIPCKIITSPRFRRAYMGYGGMSHDTKENEVLCQIK